MKAYGISRELSWKHLNLKFENCTVLYGQGPIQNVIVSSKRSIYIYSDFLFLYLGGAFYVSKIEIFLMARIK